MSQTLVIALIPKFAAKYDSDSKTELDKSIEEVHLVERLERFASLIKEGKCPNLDTLNRVLDVVDQVFEE